MAAEHRIVTQNDVEVRIRDLSLTEFDGLPHHVHPVGDALQHVEADGIVGTGAGGHIPADGVLPDAGHRAALAVSRGIDGKRSGWHQRGENTRCREERRVAR